MVHQTVPAVEEFVEFKPNPFWSMWLPLKIECPQKCSYIFRRNKRINELPKLAVLTSIPRVDLFGFCMGFVVNMRRKLSGPGSIQLCSLTTSILYLHVLNSLFTFYSSFRLWMRLKCLFSLSLWRKYIFFSFISLEESPAVMNDMQAVFHSSPKCHHGLWHD